jgi:hypothetical protein
LGQAIERGEKGGQEPIEADGRLTTCHEDGDPSHHSVGVEAKANRRFLDIGTICVIVGLDEVCVCQPSRDAKLAEAGGEAEVVADIVGDVSPTEERRLRDVNDVIQRPVEPSGDDVHDQLNVAVEQGDGPITQKLNERLTRFVEEADDTFEEKSQGAWGGGVPEGRVEDLEEDGREDLVVMPVELIRQSIVARG